MDWRVRIHTRLYYELTQFTHLFWREPLCNSFCLIPAEVPCECSGRHSGQYTDWPIYHWGQDERWRLPEFRSRCSYANFGWYALTLTMTSMYQLDCAPAHFTPPVRQWLDHHFPGRWIGRGGPVAWPARSPDLTQLDLFLWGCMKENVYEMKIASREELVAKINTTAMEICQCRLGNLQREIRQDCWSMCLWEKGTFWASARYLRINATAAEVGGPYLVK